MKRLRHRRAATRPRGVNESASRQCPFGTGSAKRPGTIVLDWRPKMGNINTPYRHSRSNLAFCSPDIAPTQNIILITAPLAGHRKPAGIRRGPHDCRQDEQHLRSPKHDPGTDAAALARALAQRRLVGDLARAWHRRRRLRAVRQRREHSLAGGDAGEMVEPGAARRAFQRQRGALPDAVSALAHGVFRRPHRAGT